MEVEECICGWMGKAFDVHQEDTRFDEFVHIQTSPLLRSVLGLEIRNANLCDFDVD